MAQMTGGEALARSLYNEGVRTIFGLPGVQLYHALGGLMATPEIRFTRASALRAWMCCAGSSPGASMSSGSRCRAPSSGRVTRTSRVSVPAQGRRQDVVNARQVHSEQTDTIVVIEHAGETCPVYHFVGLV